MKTIYSNQLNNRWNLWDRSYEYLICNLINSSIKFDEFEFNVMNDLKVLFDII
jgi:hypothetical protein